MRSKANRRKPSCRCPSLCGCHHPLAYSLALMCPINDQRLHDGLRRLIESGSCVNVAECNHCASFLGDYQRVISRLGDGLVPIVKFLCLQSISKVRKQCSRHRQIFRCHAPHGGNSLNRIGTTGTRPRHVMADQHWLAMSIRSQRVGHVRYAASRSPIDVSPQRVSISLRIEVVSNVVWFT